MTETLAIIPCRSGSKRLPRKNLRNFMGRPLIAWTIDAALKAPSVTRVIVSTDSEEIRAISEREASIHPIPLQAHVEQMVRDDPNPAYHPKLTSSGVIAPFLRPPELATDDATSEDVVIHALDWLRDNEGYSPSLLVLLQVTSPLRTAVDVEIAIQSGAHYSVTGDESRPNGAFYMATPEHIKEHKTFMQDRAIRYRMPPERSVDIDTIEDWDLAEFIARETWK